MARKKPDTGDTPAPPPSTQPSRQASVLAAAEAAGETPSEYQASTTEAARSSEADTAKGKVDLGAAGAAAGAEEGKDKKKVPASETTPAPTESEYEKLANAQADQYLSMTKALDPLTSGAALPAIDANMAQGADKMLGVSGNSGIAGWLDQQTAAAQQQGQGVTAAGAQLGLAEDANAQGIAKGLQDMGVAETDLMKAAPYQQLLSSLAAEVPYHLASGYGIPDMTAANTPGFLQQAEKNVGVTPTAAASGSNAGAKGLLPPPATTAPATYTPPAPTNPSNPGG